MVWSLLLCFFVVSVLKLFHSAHIHLLTIYYQRVAGNIEEMEIEPTYAKHIETMHRHNKTLRGRTTTRKKNRISSKKKGEREKEKGL